MQSSLNAFGGENRNYLRSRQVFSEGAVWHRKPLRRLRGRIRDVPGKSTLKSAAAGNSRSVLRDLPSKTAGDEERCSPRRHGARGCDSTGRAGCRLAAGRQSTLLRSCSRSGEAVASVAIPLTGLTPVQTLGTAFVGVHYWFENDRGVRFADPASAGLGARVRMHIRGNTPAFLTVWMSDSTHTSLELTTRSDAGPEGRWTGYRLERDLDYVVNGEFEVAPVERATRIIFLLARSQTEQVGSFSDCREKLQRIASGTASDGGSVLVREVDRATPGQVGTYLVHRNGGQAGEEFAIASTHGK